jgi:adenosylhomocysteine nucleosidase
MNEPAGTGPIAFVCAMPMELTPLVERLGLEQTEIEGFAVHRGTLGDREVVAIVTGMGTKYATEGIEQLLDRVDVGHVVVVGITGGVENETPIGTLVLPEIVVNAEAGTEHRPHALGEGTPQGTLWTSDALHTGVEANAELRERHAVVALDMETGATAAVCEARGVAWSVFRVISDRPDSNIDQEVFKLSNLDGTPNHEAIERYFTEHPERLEEMSKLAEGSTLAANNAADAAIRACGG